MVQEVRTAFDKADLEGNIFDAEVHTILSACYLAAVFSDQAAVPRDPAGRKCQISYPVLCHSLCLPPEDRARSAIWSDFLMRIILQSLLQRLTFSLVDGTVSSRHMVNQPYSHEEHDQNKADEDPAETVIIYRSNEIVGAMQ